MAWAPVAPASRRLSGGHLAHRAKGEKGSRKPDKIVVLRQKAAF